MPWQQIWQRPSKSGARKAKASSQGRAFYCNNCRKLCEEHNCCSKCLFASYCSKECQIAAWPRSHKKVLMQIIGQNPCEWQPTPPEKPDGDWIDPVAHDRNSSGWIEYESEVLVLVPAWEYQRWSVHEHYKAIKGQERANKMASVTKAIKYFFKKRMTKQRQ